MPSPDPVKAPAYGTKLPSLYPEPSGPATVVGENSSQLPGADTAEFTTGDHASQ
jgi:hypothetical protein